MEIKSGLRAFKKNRIPEVTQPFAYALEFVLGDAIVNLHMFPG